MDGYASLPPTYTSYTSQAYVAGGYETQANVSPLSLTRATVYANPAEAYNGVAPLDVHADGSFTLIPPLNQPYYGVHAGAAIRRFFKKYATFNGRASRSEFWWAYGFTVIVQLAINVISHFFHISNAGTIVSALWSLAIFIPTLAIASRRLHDANHSAAWIFAGIAGIIGLYATVTVIAAVFAFAGTEFVLVGARLIDSFAWNIGATIGLILLLIDIAASLAFVVFLAAPSDVRGVRFDANYIPAVPTIPAVPAVSTAPFIAPTQAMPPTESSIPAASSAMTPGVYPTSMPTVPHQASQYYPYPLSPYAPYVPENPHQ
ncbi:DUF805 domain-containing protein [Alloscardovia venturai]|uniref:DUF805 domain-containing protein n=1 Tax=Alloscardovia venturai TaxID=1769421 RepID=A0ABW2Y6R5_9BIFI